MFVISSLEDGSVEKSSEETKIERPVVDENKSIEPMIEESEIIPEPQQISLLDIDERLKDIDIIIKDNR